ncbi:hypothetical protein B7463_g10762, partial [Scytalidium lignicola]
MENEAGLDDSVRRGVKQRAEVAQKVKAKGKAREFKVFQPTSRSFINETKTGAFLQPTVNLPLGAEQQNQLESRFSRYTFLNAHGSRTYSPASRSAARAHVMRHVSKEKEAKRATMVAIRSKSPRLKLQDQNSAYQTNHSWYNEKNSDKIRAAWAISQPVTWPPSTYPSEGASAYNDRWDFASSDPQLLCEFQEFPDLGATENHLRLEPLLNYWVAHGWSPSPLRTGILPFSTQRSEIRLIDHFIQVLLKSSLPISSLDESRWFNKALNDEACYHATLFVSAAHQALLTRAGNNLPRNCYYHKGKALRIINQRLLHPQRRTEDGTLAAIACLASYENINGQLDAAATHIKGLESLGSLRGGFHSSDMHGLLEQLICWVDLSNASALRLRARFTPQNMSSLTAPELAFPGPEAPFEKLAQQWDIPGLESIGFRVYDGLTMPKATIFHRIRQLSFIRSKVQSMRDLDLVTQQRFTNEGATAFRNARDWTQEQRDAFIAKANEKARSMNAIPSRSELLGHYNVSNTAYTQNTIYIAAQDYEDNSHDPELTSRNERADTGLSAFESPDYDGSSDSLVAHGVEYEISADELILNTYTKPKAFIKRRNAVLERSITKAPRHSDKSERFKFAKSRPLPLYDSANNHKKGSSRR